MVEELCAIFGIIGAGIGLLTSIVQLQSLLRAGVVMSRITKAVLTTITRGLTFTSRVLSAMGHQLSARWLRLVGTITGFVANTLRPPQGAGPNASLGFRPNGWEIFELARSTGEQAATIAGNTRLAQMPNVAGIVQDIRDSIQAQRDSRRMPPDQVTWNGDPNHQMSYEDQLHWFYYNFADSNRRGVTAWRNMLD
jgi:hypothetical protein